MKFHGVILAILVFLSRVPFLGNGFGLDPDAWRVANTARQIAISGSYSYSRAPGYPIPEIVYSLIWDASPILYNAITALFSAGVFVFFALTLARTGCKRPLLGALALVFVPVIYTNSTTAMDYVWALFFILGSFHFALENNDTLAGIFLGLSIGCRITSAAMVIPIGIIVYAYGPAREKSLTRFLVWSLLVGCAAYIPVIFRYQFNFLSFSEHGYPPVLTILKNTSMDVWGILGSLVILASGLLIARRVREFYNLFRTRHPVFLASTSAIIIYALIYIRLPHEAGYLIPVVPFVLLLLFKLLNPEWSAGICVLLIASAFILNLDNRQLKLEGPIFQDRRSRIQSLQFTNLVLDQASQLSSNSLIVSGYYLPQLEYHLNSFPSDEVKTVYLLNQADLEEVDDRRTRLFYLPGIDTYNKRIYGVNLSDYGGMPLLPEYNSDE